MGLQGRRQFLRHSGSAAEEIMPQGVVSALVADAQHQRRPGDTMASAVPEDFGREHDADTIWKDELRRLCRVAHLRITAGNHDTVWIDQNDAIFPPPLP